MKTITTWIVEHVPPLGLMVAMFVDALNGRDQ